MAKMSFIIYFLKQVQYLLSGHHAQHVALSRRLVFKEASPHQSFLRALLGIAIRGLAQLFFKITFYLNLRKTWA